MNGLLTIVCVNNKLGEYFNIIIFLNTHSSLKWTGLQGIEFHKTLD